MTNPWIGVDGAKSWLDENGEYHRADGPAYESEDGKTQVWYLHGQMHRVDGPALQVSGGKYWYYRGLHMRCRNNEMFQRLLKLKAFL